MQSFWQQKWLDDLTDRKQQALFRQTKTISSAQGCEVVLADKKFINFCSNDYLGLANDAELIQAQQQAVQQWGVGSGSAHLVCGHQTPHDDLEKQLADYVGCEKALLFSTGYMANLGLMTALFDKNTDIIADKLNHASLLDGALYSGAKLKRFQHLDWQQAENYLQQSTAKQKALVSDSVFSMDGDLADLKKLAELGQQHQALLVVDDAHGFAVLGEDGAGCLAHANLSSQDVPVYMATLGKAIGCFGAFVAGSKTLIEYLQQHARTYVYTTAMPAALAQTISHALTMSQQQSWRRKKLQELIEQFQQGAKKLGLPVLPSATAIQPLLLQSSEKALQASELLQQKGFLISAIRPPTVPKNAARLRITLTAKHETKHIEQLLVALEQVCQELLA